ncbi:MAG: YqgE/AlgH family protein [Pirellulaceae bacterium]
MDSLQGQLLIAEPRLPDSSFFRTVVVMIQHSDQGATGLILNRPGNVSLSDIWDDVSDSPLARDKPIHIGGPVEGPLTALHDRMDLAEQTVIEGVYLSMSRHNLDELLASEHGELCVFSGYSGWAPGQLENELSVGGWLLLEAQPEHVFGNPDNLYKSLCEEVGRTILFGDATGDQPVDPGLN